MEEIAYCPTCRTDRVLERPECRDGHGDDCPERCCTTCATAYLVDPALPPRAERTTRRAA
ncbi:hypothetical protein [Actinocatenispora rupis]|uniref:Uncharacterized protein n=1 Tax=Actinocatenispora rupis TaxID=519421 RepID=A0A8J3J3F2_9ACTN|nr:hypothetical protein [Actinocatenispora rupis]GID13463.1 hypothetical protein Aru02nite_43520 [Actinocatenispora rupis]